MSSILNLNDTSPAAGSGYQLAKWQRGTSPAGTDPTTGLPYFDASTEVPNTGGVLKKTANYTAVAGDCGQLVSFNSGSPVTYTLSATPPIVAISRWQVAVENIGAGALTISATTAAKLDGVTAGTLVLAQNTGCKIYTDGTDYFTERGAGSTLVLEHDGVANGSQTLLNLKAGTGIVITDDGVGGLTVTASSISTTPFVQGANGFANAAPVAVPFPSANTLGNCLVAILSWSDWFSGFTSSTLSDSNGNTYTRIGGTSVNNVQVEVWVALNCAAGSNTVTASAASLNSNQTFSLAIHEYSGVAHTSALDVFNVTNSTTSVSTLSCSVTTTQAGDLLIIAGGYEGAATISASSAPGTARETVHSTGGVYPTNLATFDANASIAGAASTTITWASTVTEAAMIVVALKATIATPLTNPMTTPGDLIVGGSSGTATRLAKDADGKVLTLVSGAVAWAAPSGASVMGASGPSHAAGLAPDPGATAGSTKFLREDATWAVPAGGGGSSYPLDFVQSTEFQSGISNVASYTLTFPQAAAASGNTMFLLIACDGSSTVTIPAGWTQDLNVQQATYSRFILCHKTSASDTSATMTVGAASSFSGWFFEVAGSHALDQSSTGGSAGQPTSITLPAITPSAGAVVFGVAAMVPSTSPYQVDCTVPNASPAWKSLCISGQQANSRTLVGNVSTVAAVNRSIIPPVINLRNISLFSGGGAAYASFSIL